VNPYVTALSDFMQCRSMRGNVIAKDLSPGSQTVQCSGRWAGSLAIRSACGGWRRAEAGANIRRDWKCWFVPQNCVGLLYGAMLCIHLLTR